MVAALDERDAQMAVLGLGLTVMLIGLQVALLIFTTFSPLVGALYRLAEEEPTQPPATEQRTEAEQQRRPVPVGAILAVVGSTASGGLAVWAARRLYRGTLARERWMWVLVLSGVGCGWGLLMARLMSRVPPFVQVIP